MQNLEIRKIIVSMTSWTKRINQAHETIETILKGTVKPDYIVINLSLVEFPNKEKDLPENLLTLAQNNKSIIINFVEGNTRSFKKLIPTVKLFYEKPGKYYILTVDDDCLYVKNYVDFLVTQMEQAPDDAGSFCPHIVNIQGARMIYKLEVFKPDFWECLTEEVISYGIDDTYYDYYLRMHGIPMYHYSSFIPYIDMLMVGHNEIFTLGDEYLKDNRIQKAHDAVAKIKFDKS